MCGIAGFTHRGKAAAEGRIAKVTQALHHRGPDQWGVHESDAVSLGAVRLRIIDLAGGEQPIYSPDGDSVIVFNGEIYNHNELRDELAARGHAFKTRCDTEVVLHAFLEWDVEGFNRLHGMFAIALWTESRQRLVLARDRMGIKPLYICRRGKDIYFGSEMKAIFGHPELPRNICRAGLNWYLSLNYIPPPYTLVEGITKLPPGGWLEWKDGTIREGTYWQLQFAPRAWRLGDATEALDALLRQSVREHLLADVPLGIWASGGVDSTAVLHYASEVAAGRLKTFSIGFPGRSFDESRWFRQVARHYGTDHHEFDLNPAEDVSSAVEQLTTYCDEPSADAGALPVWYLSKMSRGHVTVALSGEGADELFGGYYTYLADRYARLIPKVVARAGLAAAQLLPVSDEKIGLDYKAKRFFAGALLPGAQAHLYWNGTFSAAERERLLAKRWFAPSQIRETSSFLELDQHYYLPDDILCKCDRMSMAHSLEVRPPFLDHRIVEFAATLPENLKVNGSQLKFVLKRLLRGKVPHAVLDRKKEGFDIPAHQWFRGVLRPLLRDTVTARAVRDSGLFDPAEVLRVFEAHESRRANYGYHLWGLLQLFLWMKRWGISTT